MNAVDRNSQQRIVEMALFVLNMTGGLDRFHLFKVLYFAERMHLANWGLPMSHERYYALDYGPVPSELYSAIKEQDNPHSFMGKLFWEAVEAAPDEARGIMIAKREPDMTFISKAGIEVLTEAVKEYAHMGFGKLSILSHGVDWKRAREKGDNTLIDTVDMAESGGAPEEVLELLEERLEVINALGTL